LVDRLERAGLVERSPDPHDRRKTLVSLAAQRGAELEAAWDVPGSTFARALDDFTDDELAVIERYLWRTMDAGSVQARRLQER
jgi:DNA-binding MarR family transcriptional regulator